MHHIRQRPSPLEVGVEGQGPRLFLVGELALAVERLYRLPWREKDDGARLPVVKRSPWLWERVRSV